jgi:hypothetical protein
MACKYTFNGKEYTERELLNLASSASSLMSVRTRTNDEMIEIMKNQASNRFVNLDLFTPYQENNYISAISADVISQIGTFKPGEKVKLSPSEAFLKTKARFENSLKVYDYLAKQLDTPAKLDQARKNKEYTKKFPQLLLAPTTDDLLLMKSTYGNILDNFDGFKTKVKVNLRKFGLKIEEGSNKFQELKLDEEYYRNIVNEDANVEEITEDERVINESYEDGSAFRVNPRDTASTRVKLFFASVPSGATGALGLREFVTYDDVIENFLEIGSELESISYDALQAELLQRSKTRPYLKNVAAMIAGLQKDNNTQLLNEILTFTNKSFQEQILVKWNPGGPAGVNVEIIKSNRNTVIRQIYNDWLEQQKTSDIITNKNGELVVNTEKAAELKKTLDEAVAGGVEQKKAWVKSFMATIGVTYTDEMLNTLEEAANNGEFKKNNLNSNFAQLFLSNNLFSILVNRYNVAPTGKTEVGYDDANNALKDEFTSFSKLAEIYYRHTPGRYHTGSSRNGENKSIYAYIAPSYLERIKKKLNYSKTFLDTVLKRSFAKNSKVLQKYAASKLSGANNVTLDIFYADSLKKDKKNRDGVVRKKQSVKEQMFEAIIKHQNSGGKTGYYNIFTLSDKTVTPVLHIDKYKLNDKTQGRTAKDLIFKQSADIKETFDFGETFKTELYNLVESEINRIVDYSKQLKAGNKLKQANFDKAFELFYLFPELNKSSKDITAEKPEEGKKLEEIRNRMYEGKTPSAQDVAYIKNVVTANFKQRTFDLIKSMTRRGLIKFSNSKSTGELLADFSFFDASYMRQAEINGLSDFQKAVYAAADFEFNYLRTQTTALQLLGADPALYYKEPFSLKNANLSDLTIAQKMSLVKSTMDEFSKRAAMFIAPGSQGVWKWYDAKGNMVDRSSYNAITISDVVKDTELFKAVETTDAQEFITLQEHIDRMMSEGRIPLDIWQSITDRLSKKNKSDNFELTDREKSVILQPAKPVHTNSVENGNGFNRIDYVKSSTYPLIPDITRGSQLDDLRKFMEANNIRSANFKTAKKVGQPEKVLTVFDENEDFITPTSSDLAGAVQTLSREGLHTQQEIPLQKEEISNISQANRVLFDGLLNVKDFILEGTSFNGKQFKDLKENIRINLFDKAKNDLSRRFGIEERGDGVVFKNKKALEQLLREEAIERNFSINDIAAIKVNKDGDLIIPPYLMARGEKFEGLINSLVSKIVRLKNPGTSLVQVSGVASKLKFSDLNKDSKSDVIWLSNYDTSKGLQYMRKTKDGVKPAQVLVSQYIRDEEGNLIDLSKFVKVDKKTGIKTLDTSTFSEELFQLVASRIPNQGHPSMLPIEVVGFLPSYMENTIVVPDGITKQMGSDFDVDKLYAYTSSLRLRYSKETESEVISLEKEMLNIKNKSEVENTELYKQYLTKQELSTIKQLKEDKNEIIDKLKWNISDREKSRKQKSIDNINTLIESVYENIKEKYAPEYLKIRQVQEKNKQATRKELDAIRTQITEAKSKGITGADKVKYDISKYDIETGWESLSDLNEDELHQMYRDLHWSVLTHRAAFDKITKSIDFNDIKEEGDMLEAMGLFKFDMTYSPMGFEEQMQIFNDNKSGKVGVGIFASLGSFLADNQDKTIILGHIDPKTLLSVPDPVRVLDENGKDILELFNLTQPGSVGDTKEDTRTKGDNNSMVMTESVDNSKNKNLYKFNWAEETMGALSALIALSDANGKILKINFATRFFKQPIIEEYVSEIQSARDTLSDFTPDVKDAVINKLVKRYSQMMSVEAQNKIIEDKKNSTYKEEIFGADKLKQMLKESLGDITDMDSYAKKQIDALSLFSRLDNIGGEISGVIGASYIYTKGVGSSVFDVIDGIRKLGRLANPGVFVGLESMAGKVEKDVNTGRYKITEPVGEIGHSIDRSLLFAEKLYNELYPVHFSSFYNRVSEKIFNGLGVDKNNVGSSRFIKLNKEIIKGVRSYLFTNPSLNISDNASSERERLLVDNADNKSLAKRIMEAKNSFPELEDNYFIKNLGFTLSTKQGLPSQVYYKSPFGDIDEIENNKGFLSLIFSGNDEQIQIAKDLALYTYLTGANQTNSSFGKFIPIEYFISDTDFLSGIKGFKKDVFNTGLPQFYRQFIQNNPDMATRLDKDTAAALSKLGNIEKFSIDTTNELHTKLLVKTGAADNLLTLNKFADYISYTDNQNKLTYLYERTSAPNIGKYERINTLGTRKAGFSEYMMNTKDVPSVLPMNMTAAQLAEYKRVYPDAPTEDNVDLDSLADGMLEDDINLDDLLDQADMFDNIDLDAVAAQEPVAQQTGNFTEADNLPPIEQNFIDGQGGRKMQSKFAGKSTMDLILSGDRTRTTRANTDITRMIKDYNLSKIEDLVGKVIRMTDKSGRTAYTKITNVAAFTKEYQDATWEKEGWDKATTDKNLGTYPYAIEFELASVGTTQDISTQLETNEEIVISDPTDNLNLDDLLGMDMADGTEINMEELENQPIEFGANPQLDPVVEGLIPNIDGNNSVKTVLNNIFKTTTNPFFKDLIKILGQAGNIKDANVIIDNTMAHPGTYAPGVIRINADLAKKDNPKQNAKDNLETVIMHEVMHAATADVLKRFRENKASLNKRQIIFATGLTNMFKDLQEKMIDSDVHGPKLTEVIDKLFGSNQDVDLSPKEKSMYYGLTNIDEFVSMLMTDRTFQQFMNETMYNEESNTSIFDRFKELLRDLITSLAKMVGVNIDKKSALYNGVDTITKLISEPDIQDHSDNESINGDPNEGPLDMNDINNPQDNNPQDYYMLKTPNGLFNANEDQVAAIDAVSEFLNRPTTEKLDDNVFLLFGPGGTGKTASVASAINKALNGTAEQVRVAYTAISHTAKGELVKAGNKEAATLASFLGSKPKITASGEETFELTPLSEYTDGEKPKPFPGIFTADWLVIDEASMIGETEMKAIRQRLEERKGEFGDRKMKILFMGDYSQIPPIGLRPDEDGYAINLMKNSSKSIGLSKIERTKNQDITDLGFRFRRAVDYYNQQLEKGIASVASGLRIDKMLDKSVTTSSENVSFTSKHKNFFTDYVNVFKQDPFNSQNAVMISYNNEKHPSTITTTDIIRTNLFGDKANEALFVAGEPIFLGSTITAPSIETGKNIEMPKNSRTIIKSINSVVKSFNIGTKRYPDYINVPVYAISAHYGKDTVNFDALDKAYSQQFIPSRYDSKRKGYILDDGSFLAYGRYMRLKEAGITDIFHGYLMSAHKVQGQTYNHSFVHDMNISSHVRPSMNSGEMILTPKSYAQILYTAISRARNKVYVLTSNVADEAGAFAQPTFENPMKSVATEVTTAEFPNDLELENQCKS